MRRKPYTVHETRVTPAFQTRNDCNDQKVFHQDYENAERGPPTIVSRGRVVALRMTSLECLPDTVDPRGPKGK